jgi:hypothetical protein
MILSLFLTLLPTAFGGVVDGDLDVEGAIHVDVTPNGFDAIGGMVPALAPEDLPVDGISDGYGGILDQCWLGGYELEVADLLIGLSFGDISITPNTGYLDIDIQLFVNVNSASDPFYMYLEAECIGDDCDGWVDPFEVNVRTTMALDVVDDADGNPTMDATIGELSFEYDLTGDDVTLTGCALGTMLDVLDFIGIDLIDLILPSVSGSLDDAVGDLIPELEATLEDAFSAAVIEQELELAGTTITISARPSDAVIRPEGMRLTMDGRSQAAESNDCVAEWDDGTFEAVSGEAPAIAAAPGDISGDYAAGLLLSDEFGNQLMYALWRAGLLCYTVDDELGFPIDTSILGLLAGDAFNELFPDAKPMVIDTRPQSPPTLEYAGANDVNVLVKDLGLDFMAELDHRDARVLTMGLQVDAGIDLNFDGETGLLGIEIALGEDAFESAVTSNDFVPDASDTIEASFGNVFNGLVGGLIGDMLGDMTFAIPGFSGLGLTELTFAPAGASEDWLGGYAWLGEVSYASTGCATDGSGGCATEDGGGGCTDATGESGCSGGGCASAPRNQRRWLWLTFPVFFALTRRRV